LFVETSAKTGYNIKQVFCTAVHIVDALFEVFCIKFCTCTTTTANTTTSTSSAEDLSEICQCYIMLQRGLILVRAVPGRQDKQVTADARQVSLVSGQSVYTLGDSSRFSTLANNVIQIV